MLIRLTFFTCYLQVSETDALSNFVCHKCWSMTESFHQLYQNAKEVQQRFFNKVVKSESDSPEIWIDNTYQEDVDQPEYSNTINSIKVEPNSKFFLIFLDYIFFCIHSNFP